MAGFRIQTLWFLMLVCLNVFAVLEGLRQRGQNQNSNNEASRECVRFHLCSCGGNSIRIFAECWEKVEDPTEKWLVETVNQDNICKGIKVKITQSTFEEYTKIWCNMTVEDQSECYDDVYRECIEYARKTVGGSDPEKSQEINSLQQAVACLEPNYQRCKFFPGQCI